MFQVLKAVVGAFSLVFAAVGARAGAAEDLLPNGDFEHGGRGWQVETGRTATDPDRPNQVSWPTGMARTGQRCARFDFSGQGWLWLDPDVPLCAALELGPQQTVRVSFWARWLSGDNRISAGFNLRGRADGAWFGGRDDLAAAAIPRDGRWGRIEMLLDTPWFDPAVACAQLKLGAHAGIDVRAESFLLDDLEMQVVPPAHRLRLKFGDGTPEDGWGANLIRVGLWVDGRTEARVAFKCNTPEERTYLTLNQGSGVWQDGAHVRVADRNAAFAYELPITEPRPEKLIVEAELFGMYLMHAALDDGPFLPVARAPKPILRPRDAQRCRVQLLPMQEGAAFIASDARPRNGVLTVSLAPGRDWPAGTQLEWSVDRRSLGAAAIPSQARRSGTAQFQLDCAQMASDKRWRLPVRFTVRDAAGGALAETRAALNVPNVPRFGGTLSELSSYARDLDRLLQEAARARTEPHDADIVLTALQCYPAYIEDDFQCGKMTRATAALDFLSAAADGAVRAVKASLAARERAGGWAMPSVLRLAPRRGSLYQGPQPVFLVGPMRDRITPEELRTIARFGFNAVELVAAPAWDAPADYGYYREFLDVCARENLAAYVMLSAHYFPNSWIKAHPEIGRCGRDSMSWCISSPAFRDRIEAWYERIIPFLRERPAVFSYCLANEPRYIDTGYCELCKDRFREWLRGRHGTLDALNRRWRTQLGAFAQAEPVKTRDARNPAPYYDWYRFNEHRMADLFQWERSVIKRLDKRTPIHNESGTRLALWSLNDGLDFEDQAAISDIHGCDDGTKWRDAGPYAIEWLPGQALPYDLMKSIAPAMPIFNSEWHVATHASPSAPPEYMRATAWLATLHGQAGATIWAWLRAFPDQDCPFLARPGIVIAAGKVTRELNRFANHLAPFQRPPQAPHRPVCLLYSTSSTAHGRDYARACRTAYEALYFLDTPLGFVTERQAERGEFRGCRLLVVPEAQYISDAGATGVERFAENGGTVVLVGQCFTRNEYGDSREKPGPLTRPGTPTPGGGEIIAMGPVESPAEAAPVFNALIDKCEVDRPVRCDAWGVVCRSAPANEPGRLVCMLINLTREEKRVALRFQSPHTRVHDVIAGGAASGPLTLPSLEVALLEISPR